MTESYTDLAIYDIQGQLLPLGKQIGRGGEATVYRLASDPNAVVKLYHQPDVKRAKKLRAMLKNPPKDPTREAGHVSIAWPTALALDADDRIQGFVMPYLADENLALHQLYNPKARRQRAPQLTWRYLVRIARNLCTVVTAFHDKGYVIGDLNESNVLVNDRALVSMVDCDSIQVRDGRRLYPCPVGKGEYTPPELQGRDFKKVKRNINHDSFALSILIFLLLMEGVHPFSGIYKKEGDPPKLLENIQDNDSPYLNNMSSKLKPSPIAPDFKQLPKPIRQHFKNAFKQRAFLPRPNSKDWKRALETLEQSLISCDINSHHVYGNHLKTCPWCERRERLGLESFPEAPPFSHSSGRSYE